MLLQDRDCLESLHVQSAGPTGAEVVEQALVTALEISPRKRARSHDARLQIAITERDGQGGLALQQGFPLIEAIADSGIGTRPQALPPVMHLVEKPSFAA